MKLTIASAALAVAMLASATYASTPELVVTPREAGTVLAAASTETGVAPAAGETKDAPAAPVAEAAKGFVIVATITVQDVPVWQGKYRHDAFDTKAACEKFIADDDGLKASNVKLAEIATAKISPDAKVGVSCEADNED